MYMRLLQGYEEALSLYTIERHISALNIMWYLGRLFAA